MKPVPCRVRTIYRFGEGQQQVEVEFFKLKERNPGWTHRVLVDGWGQMGRYWLAESDRPCIKTARFFYDKFVAEQAAKTLV